MKRLGYKCDLISQNPPLDTLAKAPFTFKIKIALWFQSREEDLWHKYAMVGFVRSGHILWGIPDSGAIFFFFTPCPLFPKFTFSGNNEEFFFFLFWHLIRATQKCVQNPRVVSEYCLKSKNNRWIKNGSEICILSL